MGVNTAESAAAPRADGAHAHVAVVDTAATDSQPEIETPSTLKFTMPARDVVAVMVFETRYCGDADASARDTVVVA